MHCLSNINAKSKVPLKLLISNFHGCILGGASLSVDLAHMTSDVSLSCQNSNGSQELVRYSENEFEKDKIENVFWNGKVELSEDHAGGVGG